MSKSKRTPWIKEQSGRYTFLRQVTPWEIVTLAKRILRRELFAHPVSSPADASNYMHLKIQALEHEEFHCLFLNTRHYPIADECLAKGTINGAHVHPREVIKRSLHHNASAVIFFHNHPSGVAEPSQSDATLTKRLRDALELIDIRVLDHLVIGNDEYVSMSDRGLF